MAVIDRAAASLIELKLKQAVGGSGVAAVDVIIVELKDSDGATGLGFSYVLGGGSGGGAALKAAQVQLETFVAKKTVAAPRALWQRIVATFNRTGLGVNLISLAAVDTA